MEIVRSFPYQVLRDYYKKWYRPDLQAVIIVGDVDVNYTEAQIKKIFADIPAPVNAAERVYIPVEDNDKPIVGIAADKELRRTRSTSLIRAISRLQISALLSWVPSKTTSKVSSLR